MSGHFFLKKEIEPFTRALSPRKYTLTLFRRLPASQRSEMQHRQSPASLSIIPSTRFSKSLPRQHPLNTGIRKGGYPRGMSSVLLCSAGPHLSAVLRASATRGKSGRFCASKGSTGNTPALQAEAISFTTATFMVRRVKYRAVGLRTRTACVKIFFAKPRP